MVLIGLLLIALVCLTLGLVLASAGWLIGSLAASAAAVLSAGVLIGTTGMIDSGALGASLGSAGSGVSTMSIDVSQESVGDYPIFCDVTVTFSGAQTDGFQNYVYEQSDAEIVLGGRNADLLPDPINATGTSVGFLLVKGTTFDVAAYAEYKGGKRSDVAHLGPQTVAC